MSTTNIIRAWKDAEYRNSLSAEELAMVPANPVGEVELRDEDLASVVGAKHSQVFITADIGETVTADIVICL